MEFSHVHLNDPQKLLNSNKVISWRSVFLGPLKTIDLWEPYLGTFVCDMSDCHPKDKFKVTSHNVDKPKRRQPKRRQTETSIGQNVDKPQRRHTQTSTDQNVDKPKRRHNSCDILYILSIPMSLLTIELKAWVGNNFPQPGPNLNR